jgi:hypothetical protein
MTPQAFQQALASFVERHLMPNLRSSISKWMIGGIVVTQLPRITEMLALAGLVNEAGAIDVVKTQEFIRAAFKASPSLYIPQLNITLEATDGEAFLTQYLAPLAGSAA